MHFAPVVMVPVGHVSLPGDATRKEEKGLSREGMLGAGFLIKWDGRREVTASHEISAAISSEAQIS